MILPARRCLSAGLSRSRAAAGLAAAASAACTTATCALGNSWIRFGSGSETSINAKGNLQQPFYYSSTSEAWYKLTFSNFPLDMALGIGNTAASHWTSSTVYNLDGVAISDATTDWAGFVASSVSGSISTGYGIVVSSRTFTLGGYIIRVLNTFSLGPTDRFVKITTNTTNLGLVTAYNMRIWAGTRDDYVGNTDSPMKTRGKLLNGGFTQLSTMTEASNALLIQSDTEAVLFHSSNPGVNTVWDGCCSFSNAYNRDPSTKAIQSPYQDGSYAAVLYLGDMAAGVTQSLTWYYAAGPLSVVTSSVVAAVAAQTVNDAYSPLPTPTMTRTLSPGSVPSSTSSPLAVTASGTGSASGTPPSTVTPSSTPSATGTGSSSVTGTSSSSATGTRSSTSSLTGTGSSSVTGTSSSTSSQTGTASSSGTASRSSTASQTGTASSSATGTSSSTSSQTGTTSSSATASRSSTASKTGTTSSSVTGTRSSTSSQTGTTSSSATASRSSTASQTGTTSSSTTGTRSSTSSQTGTGTGSSSATGTGSLSTGATPTPTATSSAAPRAVTLALSVPGGAPRLLVNDDAGLSRELRAAIAEAVGLEPARVSLTAVQAQVLAPNGTLVASGAAIALNATAAANNGTLAQNSSSVVWSTPTAQPTSGAPARLRALQPAAASGACATYRSVNVTNGTRTSVALALDLSDLAWVNNTDPADRIAALLASLFNASAPLRNFSRAWTECTGVDASAIQVLQAPSVRVGLRPSPSQLAASAPASSDAREFSGLGKGGLTALLVVLFFAVLACCCFALALCGGRRRQQTEKTATAGAKGGECDEQAAAPTRGDVAAAAMREAMRLPRVPAPVSSSV